MDTLEIGVIGEIEKYVYDKILSKPPFYNYRKRSNGLPKKMNADSVVDLPLKDIDNIIFDSIISYRNPQQSQSFDIIPLATFTKRDIRFSYFLERHSIVKAIMFVDPKCSCSSWRDIRYDNITSVEYRFVMIDAIKEFLNLRRFDTRSMIEMCNYMRDTKKALKTQINGLEFDVINKDGMGYIFLHIDKRILNNLSVVCGVTNKFEKSEEKFA